MDEGTLATAIRDRTAPSPSRFGNSWYFALRISGTGIAERPALGEVVYRCPDVWTSPDMLARCTGLPVIWEHPAGATMTGDDYGRRAVGSVVLPYVEAGECWGVVRVCDAGAAEAMATGNLSTSPAITLGPDVATIEGTERLVIEGNPAALDRVAIVPAGVWDKGGAPSGIRIDSTKEFTMADENKKTDADKEAEEKKADEATGGDPMDQVLAKLGAIADAVVSMGTRLDAVEKRPADSERKDGLAELGDEQKRTEREQRERLDALVRRGSNEQSAALAAEQARADSVAQAFGRQAEPPMMAETPHAYRVRLLQPIKHHSEAWKTTDLHTLPANILEIAATHIRADAIAASASAANIPGTLQCRTRRSDAGHSIREFFGDGSIADEPFRLPPRFMEFRPITHAA